MLFNQVEDPGDRKGQEEVDDRDDQVGLEELEALAGNR